MLIYGAGEIKNSVLEAIGNTPIVELKNISKGIKTKICAKLEFMNPGGSVKDRMALHIIEDADDLIGDLDRALLASG